MVGPQDTYEAGPNGNEVLGPNLGTNVLTTNHIFQMTCFHWKNIVKQPPKQKNKQVRGVYCLFFTTTSKVHKFQYDHIFHPSVESFEPLVSSWFVSCGLLHRCTLWIPNWAPNHQFTISWLHWIANFSTRQGALRQASQGRTSSCYSGGKGWNGRLCQILPPLNFWNQFLNDDMWHHKWWILDMFVAMFR